MAPNYTGETVGKTFLKRLYVAACCFFYAELDVKHAE